MSSPRSAHSVAASGTESSSTPTGDGSIFERTHDMAMNHVSTWFSRDADVGVK